MIIDDQKWNDIIAAAQAGIERWNSRAAERAKKDFFHCQVQMGANYTVLLTAHMPDGERKAVARELTTGELRAAKPVVRKGRLVGFTITKPLCEGLRKNWPVNQPTKPSKS